MRVEEIMTRNVVTLPRNASVAAAARAMRTSDIGAVLVEEDGGRFVGILTDRDIVLRAIADDRDPHHTPVGEVCSKGVVSVSPQDSVDEAVRRMGEYAVRRLPVIDNDRPIGILSLGDLAAERDPDSTLGQISLAPPNE